MLPFGAGVLTLAVVWLIAGDWSLVFNYAGLIGVVAFFLSGVLSGAFISGDRVRANWANEDREEREIRNAWTSKLFLFGVPNLLGAIIAYYFAG